MKQQPRVRVHTIDEESQDSHSMQLEPPRRQLHFKHLQSNVWVRVLQFLDQREAVFFAQKLMDLKMEFEIPRELVKLSALRFFDLLPVVPSQESYTQVQQHLGREEQIEFIMRNKLWENRSVEHIEYEAIMRDLAAVYGRQSTILNQIQVEPGYDLVSTLFNLIRNPPPPMPKMYRAHRLVKYTSSFQEYLGTSLECGEQAGFQIPALSTFDDVIFGIEDHTTENLHKAFETDKKEFLDTRYYCIGNHSELIKRSKSHRSRRASQDSGLPELPQFGRVHSSMSAVSCGEQDTLSVPGLNRMYSNGGAHEEYFDPYQSTPSATIEGEILPLMPLLGFTTMLSELCTLYFQVVNIILGDSLQNSCERLAVYTYLWGRFSDGAVSLDEELEGIKKLINSVFVKEFPTYPGYPPFSIWRLMVRGWVDSVYETRHSECDKTYCDLLANLRVSQLSDELLSTTPKTSKSRNGREFCYLTKLKESPVALDAEKFFNSDALTVKGLLAEYTGAVLDISLNEVSIHSKSHSEFAIHPESPYRILEKKFVKQTRKIYEEVCAWNHLDRKIMEKFISVDSCLVSQLFLNRTIRIFYVNICEITVVLSDQQMHGGAWAQPLNHSHQSMKTVSMNGPKQVQMEAVFNYSRYSEEEVIPDVRTNILKSILDEDEDEVSETSKSKKMARTTSHLIGYTQSQVDDPHSSIWTRPPPMKHPNGVNKQISARLDTISQSSVTESENKSRIRKESYEVDSKESSLMSVNRRGDIAELKDKVRKLLVLIESKFTANDSEINHHLKTIQVPSELPDEAAIFFLLHTDLSLQYIETLVAKNANAPEPFEMMDDEELDEESDERRTARINPQSEDATTQLDESCAAEQTFIFSIPWVEVIVTDDRIFDLVKV